MYWPRLGRANASLCSKILLDPVHSFRFDIAQILADLVSSLARGIGQLAAVRPRGQC